MVEAEKTNAIFEPILKTIPGEIKHIIALEKDNAPKL